MAVDQQIGQRMQARQQARPHQRHHQRREAQQQAEYGDGLDIARAHLAPRPNRQEQEGAEKACQRHAPAGPTRRRHPARNQPGGQQPKQLPRESRDDERIGNAAMAQIGVDQHQIPVCEQQPPQRFPGYKARPSNGYRYDRSASVRTDAAPPIRASRTPPRQSAGGAPEPGPSAARRACSRGPQVPWAASSFALSAWYML